MIDFNRLGEGAHPIADRLIEQRKSFAVAGGATAKSAPAPEICSPDRRVVRSPSTRAARQRSQPRNFRGFSCLDYAQQPQNEDQHQDASKTDIHDTLLLWVAAETGSECGAFQALLKRYELCQGMILPVGNAADFLDFFALNRN